MAGRAAMAVLLLWGAVMAQAAPVYRWLDADGVTHFSDTPPPKPPVTAAPALPPASRSAAPTSRPPSVPDEPAKLCAAAAANLRRLLPQFEQLLEQRRGELSSAQRTAFEAFAGNLRQGSFDASFQRECLSGWAGLGEAVACLARAETPFYLSACLARG